MRLLLVAEVRSVLLPLLTNWSSPGKTGYGGGNIDGLVKTSIYFNAVYRCFKLDYLLATDGRFKSPSIFTTAETTLPVFLYMSLPEGMFPLII